MPIGDLDNMMAKDENKVTNLVVNLQEELDTLRGQERNACSSLVELRLRNPSVWMPVGHVRQEVGPARRLHSKAEVERRNIAAWCEDASMHADIFLRHEEDSHSVQSVVNRMVDRIVDAVMEEESYYLL